MQRLVATFIVAFVGMIGLGSTVASAHFLWVAIKPGENGQAVASVTFNEDATPGSLRLAKKIAPTKAWVRPQGGAAETLDLKLIDGGETGDLEAAVDAGKSLAVDAQFQYGIFKHDDHSVLLNYNARAVAAPTAEAIAALATSDKLPLSIVPRASEGGLTFDVLWQGKPAAGCEVVATLGDQEAETLKTDDAGRAKLIGAKPGKYQVRARKVDETPGEKDGQAYEAVHHYATLTFELPVANTAATGGATAGQVLASAREARIVWDNFPGCTADLDLRQGEAHVRGKITITPDFEVRLSGLGDTDTKRVQQILDSLVQHRSASGGPDQSVTFVEEQGEHPLGRMIRFDNDKELHSAYRVKNDVVTEVNRQMGPLKFTISVLDIYRNAEGKYAPSSYNVSFWDKESGELRASETHFNEWNRISGYDLPKKIVVLRAEDGKRGIVSMELGGHRLLNATAKADK